MFTPNTPIVAVEHLETLGYKTKKPGLLNERERLKILPLQRIKDGSVPDFCFCSNMEETVGVILPQPYSFYRDSMLHEGEE